MNSPLIEKFLEFVEAIANGDNSALAAMVDADRFVAYLPGGPYEGMDFGLFTAELAKLHAAFGDFASRKDYDNFMECGHSVVTVGLMEMTHHGDLNWAGSAPLSATGKIVGMPLVEIVDFDKDGKITMYRMSGDRLNILEQLAA